MILIDRTNGKGHLIVSYGGHTKGLAVELYRDTHTPRAGGGIEIGHTLVALETPVEIQALRYIATIGTPGGTNFSLTEREFETLINANVLPELDVQFKDAASNERRETMASTDAIMNGIGPAWPIKVFGVVGYVTYAGGPNGTEIAFVCGAPPSKPEPIEQGTLVLNT